MKPNPIISVIMPVYNGAQYLKEAIESILNQTFNNFEFVIINDGSTDDSEKIILSYNDARIKYYSQKNCGLGATLNAALDFCNGIYIARQDQDDISYPNRLQKQIEVLETHPNLLLLGTRAKIITDDTTEMGFHNHADNSAILKFDLLFDNPFVHSSVIFRKNTIEKIGKYKTDRSLYEDYDLWSRMAAIGDVSNLSEVLIDYRHHEKGLSKNTTNFKENALYDQGVKNMEAFLGLKNQPYCDMLALFHWKENLYKGSSIQLISDGLEEITHRLKQQYPEDIILLNERKKQYLSVLRYRLNTIKRKKNEGQFIKIFFLKLESILFGLQSGITNKSK